MLTFLSAVYNEEDEIADLLMSVSAYVDRFAICDDGSTDLTYQILSDFKNSAFEPDRMSLSRVDHIGLPETVKNEALKMVADGSWVLMLDADERMFPETLQSINEWLKNPTADYVYFRQIEVLNDTPVREFQKAKLFRKEAITFPLNNIHADDSFEGVGDYREDWIVHHRKTTTKQIRREMEYLRTYRRLLDEGKIDEGRYNWLVNLHHYIKVPHG